MNRFLRVAKGQLAATLLAACTKESAPAAESAERAQVAAKNSAALHTYLDAEYEEEVLNSPEELTVQGRKDKYNELDDRSEAAADKVLAWRRQSVADMQSMFDPATLSDEARLSFDIWELELQRADYKVGMLAIQKLRDESRAALGDKFDCRRFHDVVLGGGGLPIPILEGKVRRWIETSKRG